MDWLNVEDQHCGIRHDIVVLEAKFINSNRRVLLPIPPDHPRPIAPRALSQVGIEISGDHPNRPTSPLSRMCSKLHSIKLP
jgi:hypothetical protein